MFTIKVLPDDSDPYTVVARGRQVLAWERRLEGRAAVQLVTSIRMADLYELAHLAARRDGLFAGSRGEFEASCDVERAPDAAPATAAAGVAGEAGDTTGDLDGDGAVPTRPAR